MSELTTLPAVVIGAGQSGLAMSWWLTRHGIEHVVLERGEIGDSWRRQRWDSLRLLTPNWQNRLPGWFRSTGDDATGFASMADTVQFLEGYARFAAAPVRTSTLVRRVCARDGGYRVETVAGDWQCRALTIASGAYTRARLPAWAAQAPAAVAQCTALDYRRPSQLPPGGVLVVGAAASGIAIADELRRSGREVTLAVGEHLRAPRRYRGLDLQWWLDATGVLDEAHERIGDLACARRRASLQLVGEASRDYVDLNALRAAGVRLVGRLVGIAADGKAHFSGSLAQICTLADLRLRRLLDRFDAWAASRELEIDAPPGERPPATVVDAHPALTLDLARDGIAAIVWATGMGPDYGWLDLPVLDRHGQLRHRGGVVDAPGLYALGLPLLRRRRSSLIDGAGEDARELSAHLRDYLARGAASPAADALVPRLCSARRGH